MKLLKARSSGFAVLCCLWAGSFAGQESQSFQSFFDEYRGTPSQDRWFVEEQLVKSNPPKVLLEGKLVLGARHERLLAARVLDDLGDKASVPFLLFAYSVSDQEMVIAVLQALRKLALSECLKLARTLVDDKRVPVRNLAFEILAESRTPEDWPLIVKGFEDASPLVRATLLLYAQPASGTLWENKDMFSFFLDCLEDSNRTIKDRLYRRLEKESSDRGRDYLLYLAANEDDKSLRDQILGSLRSWYDRYYRRVDDKTGGTP